MKVDKNRLKTLAEEIRDYFHKKPIEDFGLDATDLAETIIHSKALEEENFSVELATERLRNQATTIDEFQKGLCEMFEFDKNSIAFFSDFKKLYTASKALVWVKCSERLPKEGGRYWCYGEHINDLGISHFQWNCSYHEIEKRFSDRYLTDGETITHWRPLMPPPDESNTSAIVESEENNYEPEVRNTNEADVVSHSCAVGNSIEEDDDDYCDLDDDGFQPCVRCDLPDACADFGCAIKNGVRKYYPKDGIF